METEREIVGAAVPFAVGTAFANTLFPTLCNNSIWLFAAASAAFASTSVAAFLYSYHKHHIARLPLPSGRCLIAALFFMAGMTICLTGSIPYITDTGHKGKISGFISDCADRLKSTIDSIGYSDERCGSLVKAFLTGDRSGLDYQTKKIFRDSGASHLLALSGMHIGIIYLILSKALSFLGNHTLIKKLRSVTIIFGAGFFTMMTGASPSIVRAFLFILLNETASMLHRKQNKINLLCTALMIQLVVSPGAIKSAGFQLSYLAMTGIFVLYPAMQKWWKISETPTLLGKTAGKIWDMAALSIACQVFTGPLAYLRFGTLPRYFLLTNLLCIPLMNLIMLTSIIVIALTAAGTCPSFLLSINDTLLRSMIFTLETISSL